MTDSLPSLAPQEVRVYLCDQHTNSRGLLRRHLGALLNQPADTLQLSTSAHGKPQLQGEHLLHFNVSHSGDFLALAFSVNGPVGVDIEDRSRTIDATRLARRFFCDSEAAALAQLAEPLRTTCFYRLWTLKEAHLKARAGSIFDGLTRPAFSVDEIASVAASCADDAMAITSTDASQYWISSVTPHYQLAIAVLSQQPQTVHIARSPLLEPRTVSPRQ